MQMFTKLHELDIAKNETGIVNISSINMGGGMEWFRSCFELKQYAFLSVHCDKQCKQNINM